MVGLRCAEEASQVNMSPTISHPKVLRNSCVPLIAKWNSIVAIKAAEYCSRLKAHPWLVAKKACRVIKRQNNACIGGATCSRMTVKCKSDVLNLPKKPIANHHDNKIRVTYLERTVDSSQGVENPSLDHKEHHGRSRGRSSYCH
jgi:hypothetical protein